MTADARRIHCAQNKCQFHSQVAEVGHSLECGGVNLADVVIVEVEMPQSTESREDVSRHRADGVVCQLQADERRKTGEHAALVLQHPRYLVTAQLSVQRRRTTLGYFTILLQLPVTAVAITTTDRFVSV